MKKLIKVLEWVSAIICIVAGLIIAIYIIFAPFFGIDYETYLLTLIAFIALIPAILFILIGSSWLPKKKKSKSKSSNKGEK